MYTKYLILLYGVRNSCDLGLELQMQLTRLQIMSSQ